ncbi:MAG: adenine deaminase, partial [Oscillospiraceae bacterium]|nr:adenine deaminase [Oscillospiraceae bacterium]
EADVAINGGRIVGVGDYEGSLEIECSGKYIIPGFIDGHIHIESTLLTPLSLSRFLLPLGTTTLIADPHEIVNVSGALGMGYMLNTCERAPMNIHIMLPSCVPATPFDTNGAGELDYSTLFRYAKDPRVLGLGEVMSYNEVLAGKPSLLDLIELFSQKPMDGHAPGISRRDTECYRLCGMVSDHECSSFEDALIRLRAGFHLHIREGSASRNLESIVKGMLENNLPFDFCSFCTDDIHVDDIAQRGHINNCVNMGIALGMSPVDAIRCATINTARLYGLKDCGAVSAGMRADIIIADDLFNIQPELVLKDGVPVTPGYFETFKESEVPAALGQSVVIKELKAESLAVPCEGEAHVIKIVPGTLLTEHIRAALPSEKGLFKPDSRYNKLVVAERHGRNGNVSACALEGYGLERGAIASSFSHDSHNIVAAGVSDSDLLLAIRRLKEIEGGYVVAAGGEILAELPLPIAGLMTSRDEREVSLSTRRLVEAARTLGVKEGVDPLMTLSFLALPVIPSLRLLDTGLFDVDEYSFAE